LTLYPIGKGLFFFVTARKHRHHKTAKKDKGSWGGDGTNKKANCNNSFRRIQSGEVRKIRTLLQDFTNSYRRRNVAPREGLGRLEATKFRFAG